MKSTSRHAHEYGSKAPAPPSTEMAEAMDRLRKESATLEKRAVEAERRVDLDLAKELTEVQEALERSNREVQEEADRAGKAEDAQAEAEEKSFEPYEREAVEAILDRALREGFCTRFEYPSVIRALERLRA